MDATVQVLKTSLRFPLKSDGRGRLQRVSGDANVEQEILHWLRTQLGEQMYARTKGIGIGKWLHMPAADVAEIAPGEIELGLLQWCRKLKTVKAAATADEPNRTVKLSVRYRPLGYEIEGNMTYNIKLGGRAS